MTKYKERPNCRVAIERLIEKYDCTLQELHEGKHVGLVGNLRKQCEKMLEEESRK